MAAQPPRRSAASASASASASTSTSAAASLAGSSALAALAATRADPYARTGHGREGFLAAAHARSGSSGSAVSSPAASDGLPSPSASLRAPPGAASLMGASRYGLASARGRERSSRPHARDAPGAIGEMADEDDDEADDDGDLWRHDRRAAGLLAPDDGDATPAASRIGGFRAVDEEDPFVGHASVDDARAVPPPHAARTTPSAPGRAAYAQGWLAHAASSTTGSSSGDDEARPPSAARTPRSAAQRQAAALAAAPADGDIFRRPSDSDDDQPPRQASRPRAYASSVSSPTSSRSASPVGARRAENETLLSSAEGSTLPLPPGAFTGRTTRQGIDDVYAYPHPPAHSGWTPWAPGNAVAWREWKDKGALAAWALVLLATVLIGGVAALGAQVRGDVCDAMRELTSVCSRLAGQPRRRCGRRRTGR
jgi:hypothetical protein